MARSFSVLGSMVKRWCPLASKYLTASRRADRVRAAARVALEFWTWRRLANEGLDDESAADLMADAVEAAARPTRR